MIIGALIRSFQTPSVQMGSRHFYSSLEKRTAKAFKMHSGSYEDRRGIDKECSYVFSNVAKLALGGLICYGYYDFRQQQQKAMSDWMRGLKDLDEALEYSRPRNQ